MDDPSVYSVEYLVVCLIGLAASILYVINIVYRFRLKPKYTKLIAECEISQALELRKKYKQEKENCRNYAILLAIINIVLVCAAKVIEGESVFVALLLAILYLVAEFTITTIRSFLYDDTFVKLVSTYTKEEFLEKYEQFVLYLRAFESDEYEGRSKKLMRKIEAAVGQDETTVDALFSEKKMVDMVDTLFGLPVGAVGMPREADQPEDAAIRIYVDSEKWQDDVLELIEKAEFIFVLVASSESCLWEIRHLDEFMDKTIFIIDDIDEYNRSRNSLANELVLPGIPEHLLSEFDHFILYRKSEEYVSKPFELSDLGYKNIVSFTLELMMQDAPICFDRLFVCLDELFNQSIADGSDDVIGRFSKSVNEVCPIEVNDQIKISACEFLKTGELFIGITVPKDSVDWLLNNRQKTRLHVRNALLTETCELFKIECLNEGVVINFDNGAGEIVLSVSLKNSDLDEGLDIPVHLQGNPENTLI